MSTRTLNVIAKPLVASATAIHDGSNNLTYPPKLEGFLIQAHGGDVSFGGPGVTGESDGFTVKHGDTVSVYGFLSRGSPFSYDLTQLYYIGGPWKLIVEETT